MISVALMKDVPRQTRTDSIMKRFVIYARFIWLSINGFSERTQNESITTGDNDDDNTLHTHRCEKRKKKRWIASKRNQLNMRFKEILIIKNGGVTERV